MGEHLPCKQGVKSSNLSVSSRQNRETDLVYAQRAQKLKSRMYLEKSIQSRKKDIKQPRKEKDTRRCGPVLGNAMPEKTGKKEESRNRDVPAEENSKVKQERAQGGCLGTKSRRKTR